MPTDLDVLVVDDRPESVRFLTEFLIQRSRRVDVCASVREATTALTRRRAANEHYHLIFCDFAMPEADGLALLRELRSHQDAVPFVFVTGYRGLNPTFEPEAKRLGAMAILDKPLNLQQIETLLAQVSSDRLHRSEARASADQPFFGTSRMYRRDAATAAPPPPPATSEALERRVATPAVQPPARGWQAPGLGALEPTAAPLPPNQPPAPAVPLAGYQRRPSGLIPMTTSTARIRRSVDPGAPQATGGTGRITRNHTPQPPTAFTTRTRRGVEGTAGLTNPAARTDQGRMVECSNCHKQFLAAAKAEAFTTVCVHCGQLQRIEPA